MTNVQNITVLLPATHGSDSVCVRLQRQVRDNAPKSPAFTLNLQEALGVWSGATDKLEALAADAAALKHQLLARHQELRQARQAYRSTGAVYARLVEVACHGEPAVAIALGLRVKAGGARNLPVEAPTGLVVAAARHAGSVTLTWKRALRARSYQVQTSADPPTEASWKTEVGVTRRSHTIAGLPGGARMLFRVATVGASSQSVFCEPVVFTVR